MDAEHQKRAVTALKAAMAKGHRAGVNDACRMLVVGEAGLGAQWPAIATLLQHNGEHQVAVRAAALWVRQTGGSAQARFAHAAVLARAGRLADAAKLLGQLPDTVPTAAANAFSRGTIATNLGRFDEARAQLRRAVDADPAAGQAWLALAMIGRIAEPDMRAIEKAGAATARAVAPQRSAWLYALGKVHAERGAHDAAFAAFGEGAALMRAGQRYDPSADAAHAEASRAGWTSGTIADGVAALGDAPPSRPIFVAGLPRSGTTLVEQILASHSAVAGGEELGLFRLLEQDIGGSSQRDLARYIAKGGRHAELRALYDHLLGQRFAATARVVDKTLNASRHMGLIASLFPDAPILWVRRDPLDCAWSGFRTWFLSGLNWSWSLTDIAAHFKVEDALFAHWTALLGERILVVDYARLVSEPDEEIARIAAHCGLALEPGQLRPHETARGVTTSSVAQVREPINRRALGAATPYRRHLQPFVDAYGYAG